MVKNWTLILLCLWNLSIYAQLSPNQLRDYIANNKSINKDVKNFYTQIKYQTAWTKIENQHNYKALQDAISHCSAMGLSESDYSIKSSAIISKDSSTKKIKIDTLETELLLTATAIKFYNDIAYGNKKPSFGYNGLKIEKDGKNVTGLLVKHISNNNLHQLINQLTTRLPEITVIENTIKKYLAILAENGFQEQKILQAKLITSNLPLISKLYQLGIIESNNAVLTDSLLKVKIKEVQLQFNQLPDGIIRTPLLNELNVPIQIRLQQLNLSLNYYKWFTCAIQNQKAIVVNIPAANLKVYNKDFTILEMKMIVGKKSTPTPTLTSTVEEVILYPYWHVPYSIAIKELLPIIKRNPGYIHTGNYQVLNKAGSIIDPYSINWQLLNKGNFPYLIRQSTGCDNALGLLKLNFNNPFGVYLHDTPVKSLFKLNKRYLSHGCMRMEKPNEIGHLVLSNNPQAIDTLEQKGCLRNQSPIKVSADEKLPVIVWYNPVGIESTGHLVFYEDIYEKFNWVKKNSELNYPKKYNGNPQPLIR